MLVSAIAIATAVAAAERVQECSLADWVPNSSKEHINSTNSLVLRRHQHESWVQYGHEPLSA